MDTLPRAGRGQALFGWGGSLLLAAALVTPFGLLELTDHEPYPAVIFPGGGQFATSLQGERAVFLSSTLIGQSPAGDDVVVDRTELLDPIPASHLGGIIGTEFGQDTTPTQTIRVRKTGLALELPRHVPSAADRQAALRWVAAQLEALGLRPDVLIMRTERVTVDHATGAVLEREVVEEVDLLG